MISYLNKNSDINTGDLSLPEYPLETTTNLRLGFSSSLQFSILCRVNFKDGLNIGTEKKIYNVSGTECSLLWQVLCL